MHRQSQSRQFRNRRGVRLTAAVAAGFAGVLMGSSHADAQTYTWSSGVSGNFSTGFDGGPTIISGPTTQFVFTNTAAQAGYTATNDISPLQLNSLTVANANPSANASSPVFIASSAGGPLTFNGANPQMNFTGVGSTNVSSPVTSVAGMVFNNSGAGTVMLAGSQTFASNSTTTIINSGPGVMITADCTTVPLYGTNILLNLANTGTGQFLMGDISVTSAVLNSGPTGIINVSQGTVTAANTGGDLFDNTTVLNIAAGATFNFNNNAETMGGISGAGSIILGTAGLTLVETGDRSFSGVISGTGGVAQDVANILLFSGSNTYSGTTTVEAGGTIRAGAANAMSPASVVSVTNGTIDFQQFSQTVAGLSGGNLGGNLNLGNSTLTINPVSGKSYNWNTALAGSGNVVIDGAGVQSLLGVNTYTGSTTITLGTLRMGADTLTTSGISVASGANFDAIILGNTTWSGTLLTGTGGFIKEGTGTLTFNSAVGLNASSVTAAAGNLVFNQSDGANTMGVNPALVMTGGSFALVGNASASTTQTVNGLTLAVATASVGGAGEISVIAGVNQNATLSLGAITRNAGSAVDFNAVGNGTGTATISTTAALTNGIIGGFATFNQSSWATTSGTSIVPLPAGSYSGTFATGNNTAVSSSTKLGTSSATTTTNSLELNNSGAITFNASTNVLLLQSGGILLPAGVNTATSIGATGLAGKLESSTNDVIINDFASQPLTITSVIANSSTGTATNLTKAGGGTLVLAAANTFNGTTYIDGGRVVVTASSAFGATASPLVINGGTLNISQGSLSTFESTIHPMTIGPAGATFEFNLTGTNVAFQGGGLLGSGNIVSNGIGIWSVGSNASTFSGKITLNAGGLLETSNQLTSATGLTVNSGAQFIINDNATANWGIGGGAPVTLSGSGPAASTYGQGALILTVQSAGPGPISTFVDPITFAGDSTVGVYSGVYTGVTYHSELILAGAVTGPGNLIKAGTDLLVLSNPGNSFGGSAGTSIITNGTLMDGVTNALPTTTTLQFGQAGSSTAGIFDLGGFNQTLAGITVGAGSGHQIVNSGAAASVLTVNYNGTTGDNFTGQIGGGTVGSPASNNISLVKTGSGTLTLAGTLTMSGAVNVSSGALRVSGDSTSILPTNFTVNDGATLIVTNTDGSAYPMSSLTLGISGTSNLNFELNDGVPTAGALAIGTSNGLALNGSVNVAVSSASALSVGEFPLITYTGSLQGNGSFGTLSLPSRVLGVLVNNTSGGSYNSIDLDITGVDYLHWAGVNGSNWDINTTKNFALNSNGSLTTYLDEPSPDTVVFDDTAAGTHTVNLTTVLNPASVTVTTATSYTFAGTGSINGSTGLTVNGTGTLNILTNNTYSGATTIASGTVVLGSGGTTGSLGSGPITNNGTLVVNRSDSPTIASSITGSGSLAWNGSNTLTINGALNLGGNVSIPTGILSLAGGGTLTGNVTGAGTINVPTGTLQIGNGGTSGLLGSVNVTLPASTSTLVFNRTDSTTSSGNITGAGNITVANGSVLLTGSLAYTGATTIGTNTLEIGSNYNTSLYGLITGTGTFNKSGAGQLTIFGKNENFTGTVNVDGGSILLEDNGTGGDLYASQININNGGRFIFGLGTIPNENPNFPNTTFVTIYTGGVYESRVGEDWGATSLQGGTLLFNGSSPNVTFQATGGPFLGFDLQSGTVDALLPGTITSANYSGGLIKSTTGTVSFIGPVSVGTTTPIFINAGTLSFQAQNIPSTGSASSATISFGDSNDTGTLQMVDTASASTVRPVNLNGNAVIDLEAPAGNNSTGSLTLAGAITGNGVLTEIGTGTVILSSPSNSFGGATNISSGTLELARTGVINNSQAINVNTAATLLLAGSTSNTPAGSIAVKYLPPVNIAAGGTVVLAPSSLNANRLLAVANSISMAGTVGAWTGRIDLGNNDMDVPSGNLALLTSMVAQGYNGGNWNGATGIASSAAAGNSSHLTALGVIQNTVDGTTSGAQLYGGALGSFDGINPSATDVLIKYTYYGDTNLDGTVDGSDYARIDAAFAAETPTSPISGWYNGDFNYDGVVNGSDYTLIDNAFNSQGATISAQVAAQVAGGAGLGGSAVPEPASLALVAMGSLALLGRKSRRR
jgi:autotransporter-associated beta strand protein